MELLTPPRTVHLQDMNVETMHQQSMEWLNEISFWQTEIGFLYDVLSEKAGTPVFQDDTSAMVSRQNRISKIELKALEERVQDHEKYLDHLITDHAGDEKVFREAHEELTRKFREMEARYRAFKKEIMALTKPSGSSAVAWNATLTTIYNRRSVRMFKQRMPAKEIIEQVIDAARMAPNALNCQAWKFYVVTSGELIRSLSAELANLAESYFHASPNKSNQVVKRDPVFYEAPVIIFITSPVSNEWADLEAGMCAENLMLAAKSIGLDSCVVGSGRLAGKTSLYPRLRIPSKERVRLAIALGYGDEKPVTKERKKDNAVYIEEAQ